MAPISIGKEVNGCNFHGWMASIPKERKEDLLGKVDGAPRQPSDSAGLVCHLQLIELNLLRV